jgi:regulatory protein
MAEVDRLSAARQALVAAEAAAGAGTTGPREPGAPGSGEAGSGAPDPTADPASVARRIVLRQLAMGPRTRRQLEDKLCDRGCDPAVAAGVLDRMSEVGLVDDEAFAEMFVRSRRETKGLAAVALRRELRDKGVADDVVDAALEEIDPEREKEQARALVSRRLRTMRGLDRDVQTRRLAAFLARKGYGWGASVQVIREALDDLPEHARD